MKQILFFGLIFLLLGSTVLAQEMFEETDYKLVGQNQKSGEYVNQLLGFTLKPPADWTINVRDENPQDIMVEMMSSDQQCTLNLNIVENSATPQEVVDEVKKTVDRTVADEHATSVPVVGNDAAIELVTSFTYLDQAFTGHLIVFKKGKYIYKFDGWAPEIDADALKSAMRKTVDNFTFKKAAPVKAKGVKKAAAPAKKKTKNGDIIKSQSFDYTQDR
ncbi:MAG: hypothetical protein WC645_08800 [Candidatus Margulisiibacteriota bacterium]